MTSPVPSALALVLDHVAHELNAAAENAALPFEDAAGEARAIAEMLRRCPRGAIAAHDLLGDLARRLEAITGPDSAQARLNEAVRLLRTKTKE